LLKIKVMKVSTVSTTVRYGGVDLEVKGEYTPYDAGVWRYADGSGQPPSAAEFHIEEILFNEVDVFDIYDGMGQVKRTGYGGKEYFESPLDAIAELAVQKIEDKGEFKML